MKNILRSFIPHSLNTHPAEWARAAIGASLGVALSALLCQLLFGADIALHLLGPVGASAVLLFAVSTGALAQPWSIVGSYLISALSALLCIHLMGNTFLAASFAVWLAIPVMCLCRCLHPPAAAVAICIVISKNELSPMGLHVLGPVMLNAGCLLLTALIYNNLTRMRYPRLPAKPAPAPAHVIALPERAGFNAEDLEKALDELGEFVDVSREDLEKILHKTEEYALRRTRDDIDTEQILARSTQNLSLQHSMADAMKLLAKDGNKYLPVLDAEQKVIGIVTLVE